MRSDADARPNGCQEISCERLRDGERSDAVAQRVGVVAEVGMAVEIVEIAFQPRHKRTGLPIAAGLSAGEQAVGICAAAPVGRDQRGISTQQMGARVDC
jgi:hypothetical protein